MTQNHGRSFAISLVLMALPWNFLFGCEADPEQGGERQQTSSEEPSSSDTEEPSSSGTEVRPAKSDGGLGSDGSAGIGGSAGRGGTANRADAGGSATGDGGSGTGDGGSATGDGGTDAEDGGTGRDAGPAPRDLGQGDGKDVITIGDSYMNLLRRGVEMSLETISGRDYRNYGFPGTLVVNEQIPNQYLDAKMEDPDIKTVVMTGGGNDILTSSCSGTCNDVVENVWARMDRLFMQMAMDGVQDVILIAYGDFAVESKRATFDYLRMQGRMKCKKDSMPRCHFIDPVQQLDGELSSDGIHPTPAGYDILGKLVWDLMNAEGMRR